MIRIVSKKSTFLSVKFVAESSIVYPKAINSTNMIIYVHVSITCESCRSGRGSRPLPAVSSVCLCFLVFRHG